MNSSQVVTFLSSICTSLRPLDCTKDYGESWGLAHPLTEAAPPFGFSKGGNRAVTAVSTRQLCQIAIAHFGPGNGFCLAGIQFADAPLDLVVPSRQNALVHFSAEAPKTALEAAPNPFSALFDNRKSLFRNIFHISPCESKFWSVFTT